MENKMQRTSLSDAIKVVKKHFEINEENIRFLKKLEGTTHDSYIFDLDNNKIVVRLATKENDDFYLEIWFLEKINNFNIKAPKLLEFDDSKKLIPFRYSIETYVNGVHASNKNKKELIKAYTLMVNQGLESIHNIKLKNFGKILIGGNGELSSWNKFLEKRYNKGIENSIKNRILDGSVILEIEKIHNFMISKINLKKGSLLLGDLHPQNFFINDRKNKFESFIDFKSILSGDPIYEFALIYNYIGVEIWPNYIVKNVENQLIYYYYMILIVLNKANFHFKTKKDYSKKINLLINIIKKFNRLNNGK